MLETLCVQEGVLLDLVWHERRMQESYRTLYGRDCPYTLSIDEELLPQEEEWRARFLYGREGGEWSFYPYKRLAIKSFALVAADGLDYALKWADRSALEALFAQRGEADEVILVQDGLLTDTSKANIAFLREGRWWTPERPLLWGTCLLRHLEEGRLHPASIGVLDLASYEAMTFFNSFWDFEPENPARHYSMDNLGV